MAVDRIRSYVLLVSIVKDVGAASVVPTVMYFTHILVAITRIITNFIVAIVGLGAIAFGTLDRRPTYENEVLQVSPKTVR